MEFTYNEQRAAVESCMGSSVNVEEGPTGLPDKYKGTQELIRVSASLLLQTPEALPYLAFLKVGRINWYLSAITDALVESLSAVKDFSRGQVEVDTALITRARERIFQAYTQSINDLVPTGVVSKAVSFLSTASDAIVKQIKSGGKFRRSKLEAIAYVQNVIKDLPEYFQKLREEIYIIINASVPMGELERAVLAGILQRAGYSLAAKERELVEMTPEERSLVARETYLALKATEIVLNFKNKVPTPLESKVAGEGAVANSASAPARWVTPAVLTATDSGPHAVTPATSTLSLTVNDVAETITLPESTRAFLTGIEEEPFVFIAETTAFMRAPSPDTYTHNNDPFHVYIDDVKFSTIITPATRSATQLANFLNLNLVSAGGVAFTTAAICGNNSYMGANHLYIRVNDAGRHIIIIGDDATANAVMGFSDWDSSDDGGAHYIAGNDGNRELVLSVGPHTDQTVTLPAGSQTAAALGVFLEGALADVNAGDDGSGKLGIEHDLYGDASRLHIMEGSALPVLGFFENQISQGASIFNNNIVTAINALGGVLATNSIITRSEGTCATILTEMQQIELPAGEGAGVSAGDMLHILEGENKGTYLINNIIGDIVELDRSLIRDSLDGVNTIDHTYIVLNDVIVLTSTNVTALNSNLTAGANSLGLPTATVYGSASGFDSEAALTFARVGDILNFNGERTIASINNKRLEVVPEIPMNTSAGSFTITSAETQPFAALKTALLVWEAGSIINFNELNRKFNQARVTPSTYYVATLETALQEVLAMLTSLAAILTTYSCRRVPEIDTLLDTLREKGEDKASDDLINLDFTTFLAITEPMSYSDAARHFLHMLLQEHRQREVTEELDEFVLGDY